MENNMNISENKPERKKVIFSGIQPTSGAFTLGNYLALLKTGDCFRTNIIAHTALSTSTPSPCARTQKS